jgi:protein phosphatase
MSESLVDWKTYLQVASLSDVGMRRQTNQDNMSVALASNYQHWQEKGHLFIVADGMGAHAAGELASKLAIDHIPHLYARFNEGSPGECLRQSMVGANTEINRRGMANEEFHNMGTTCSSLLLLPQGAVVGHIGDSRVYRLSGGRLEQLTFDHSLVWEMKAAGQLTQAEENSGKIPKNVITRSLGPYADCKIDLEGPFPLKPNDTFLLCSDGLTGVISDSEIGSILSIMTPDEAVRVLVDLANLRGGPDNVTVVIVKVLQPNMAGPEQPVPRKRPAGNSTPKIVSIVVLAISVLFVVMFCLTKNYLTAIVPGIFALGSLIFLLYQHFLTGFDATNGQSGGRFGRGPYVRVDCASGEQFASQMSQLLAKLRAGAIEQNWNIDTAELDRRIGEAEAAVKSKQFPQAVRQYGRTISFMMEKLRNQNTDSDSSIDL